MRELNQRQRADFLEGQAKLVQVDILVVVLVEMLMTMVVLIVTMVVTMVVLIIIYSDAGPT